MNKPCDNLGRPTGAEAFTLVELLVVIAIIGLLVGILVPTIATAVRQSEDTRTRARIQELAGGCQGYYNIYNCYPGQDDPSVLKGNGGLLNGTQLLAIRLGLLSPTGTGMNLTGTGMLAPLKAKDIIAPNGVINCISDRTSNPMAILYYPARLGLPQSEQYKADDNSGLLVPGGAWSSVWSKPGFVGTANINPGAFIFLAAGASRSYTAGDLIRYPGE